MAPSFSIITTMTWGAAELRAEAGLLEVLELPERGEVPELLVVLVEWLAEGLPDAAHPDNKALEPASVMAVRTRLPRRVRSRVPFGTSLAIRISRSPP